MANGKAKSAPHKKRFGQYFSGKKVAETLFSLLPADRTWTTVVDPMAGIGDMLAAVRERSVEPPFLLGVEIDEAVAGECAERIPEARIYCEDSFVSKHIITPHGWDLVMTNPPYVRYQLQNEDDVMPSSQEIRQNLIRQMKAIPYLPDDERGLFLKLAEHYSGLSDMAVPAWILCAALVKDDGYLAIVVPEAWLNRDYAGPIQYLLQKCFQIETIARDTDAKWFSDALVKTCLVVARRKKLDTLISGAAASTRIIENHREYAQRTATLFPHMKLGKASERWVMPEDSALFSGKAELPYELSEMLREEKPVEYASLADMGIHYGQGLRTGANGFFYVTVENDGGNAVLVRSASWDDGGKAYRFSKADIVYALRNRNEIAGLVVTPGKLSAALVYPRGMIRGDLKSYIEAAEKYRDSKGRRFQDYSAVRPNEKIEGGEIVREWFRLPNMTPRHTPDLCFTRVSANVPECLFVRQHEGRAIAVDANMVTLWSENARMNLAMFAILNSTWCKLSLELICTVMGGGALKIEAAHLRKLLLPKLAQSQLSRLEAIGAEIVSDGRMMEKIQDRIDGIMLSAYTETAPLPRMRELLRQKHRERTERA